MRVLVMAIGPDAVRFCDAQRRGATHRVYRWAPDAGGLPLYLRRHRLAAARVHYLPCRRDLLVMSDADAAMLPPEFTSAPAVVEGGRRTVLLPERIAELRRWVRTLPLELRGVLAPGGTDEVSSAALRSAVARLNRGDAAWMVAPAPTWWILPARARRALAMAGAALTIWALLMEVRAVRAAAAEALKETGRTVAARQVPAPDILNAVGRILRALPPTACVVEISLEAERRSVSVRGRAGDYPTVSLFADRLQLANVLTEAPSTRAALSRTGTEAVIEFTLDGRLR